MALKLVDYLSYEPEENGILWIKFGRPDRLNALVGAAEENGTVGKVGEYMRAGDDDPKIRVIILTGVGRAFCAGADLRSRIPVDVTGQNFPGNRGARRACPEAARAEAGSDVHAKKSLTNGCGHARRDPLPSRIASVFPRCAGLREICNW